MQLTIVLPTYNEKENLPKIINVLFDLPLPDLKVLIVDDNSPDGTGVVADVLASQYPNRISVIHRAGKLGLGTAYIQGFKQALEDGAEAIGQMDCDFSHPVEKVPVLLAALEHSDFSLGSRYIDGGSLDVRWPLWRKWLSTFGNTYARTILNLPIADCTGGFRTMRRDVLSKLPLDQIRSSGYAFQVELVYLMHRYGFRYSEVPIYFAERNYGESKMSLRIQIEAALRVWQIRFLYRDKFPTL
jgi:dolichol-phosphate mannosyltransferase